MVSRAWRWHARGTWRLARQQRPAVGENSTKPLLGCSSHSRPLQAVVALAAVVLVVTGGWGDSKEERAAAQSPPSPVQKSLRAKKASSDSFLTNPDSNRAGA